MAVFTYNREAYIAKEDIYVIKVVPNDFKVDRLIRMDNPLGEVDDDIIEVYRNGDIVKYCIKCKCWIDSNLINTLYYGIEGSMNNLFDEDSVKFILCYIPKGSLYYIDYNCGYEVCSESLYITSTEITKRMWCEYDESIKLLEDGLKEVCLEVLENEVKEGEENIGYGWLLMEDGNIIHPKYIRSTVLYSDKYDGINRIDGFIIGKVNYSNGSSSNTYWAISKRLGSFKTYNEWKWMIEERIDGNSSSSDHSSSSMIEEIYDGGIESDMLNYSDIREITFTKNSLLLYCLGELINDRRMSYQKMIIKSDSVFEHCMVVSSTNSITFIDEDYIDLELVLDGKFNSYKDEPLNIIFKRKVRI